MIPQLPTTRTATGQLFEQAGSPFGNKNPGSRKEGLIGFYKNELVFHLIIGLGFKWLTMALLSPGPRRRDGIGFLSSLSQETTTESLSADRLFCQTNYTPCPVPFASTASRCPNFPPRRPGDPPASTYPEPWLVQNLLPSWACALM